jgi:hypothetical protein
MGLKVGLEKETSEFRSEKGIGHSLNITHAHRKS